ncbi:hypothetical protein YC2023_107902 [Brassica napus]
MNLLEYVQTWIYLFRLIFCKWASDNNLITVGSGVHQRKLKSTSIFNKEIKPQTKTYIFQIYTTREVNTNLPNTNIIFAIKQVSSKFLSMI